LFRPPLPPAPPEPPDPDLLELALRLDFTDPLPAGLEVLLSWRRPPPVPVPEVAIRTSSAEAAGRAEWLRGPLGVVPFRKAPPLPPRLLLAELAVESPSLEEDRCRDEEPLPAGWLLIDFGVFLFNGSDGDAPSRFPSRLDPRSLFDDFTGDESVLDPDCTPWPVLRYFCEMSSVRRVFVSICHFLGFWLRVKSCRT